MRYVGSIFSELYLLGDISGRGGNSIDFDGLLGGGVGVLNTSGSGVGSLGGVGVGSLWGGGGVGSRGGGVGSLAGCGLGGFSSSEKLN